MRLSLRLWSLSHSPIARCSNECVSEAMSISSVCAIRLISLRGSGVSGWLSTINTSTVGIAARGWSCLCSKSRYAIMIIAFGSIAIAPISPSEVLPSEENAPPS